MRRLPPLNALRVFEVAARTSSYAEAAAELGLTHGAVSRQISILEDWLGQRLFIRSGRRMVATPIARVFAAEVSLSFDRLTGAAEACGKPNVRRILRVSAPTTFASRWLIPRLGRFHDSHPLVEVSVTTVSTVLEEDAEIMTNTGLAELLVDQTPEVQEEILAINADSRIISLQVALLVPILAGLLGVLNAFRMRRLPDPKASAAAEGTMLG